MEEFKQKRGVIKAALTRFSNSLNDDPLSAGLSAFKAKFNSFKELENKFEDVQFKIECLIDQNDTQAVAQQENERIQFENTYFKNFGRAVDIIDNAEGSNTSRSDISTVSAVSDRNVSETSSSDVFLPKISIPKFNGDLGKWVKFRDTFTSLVHENSKLNNIQKFTYLEDAIVGKALSAIEGIGISGNNYSIAWEKLKNRYEDTGELKYHHFKEIFQSAAITKNSSEELQVLIDTFDNNISALNSLKEPTKHWDSILIFILTHFKLNNYLKGEWDKYTALNPDKVTFTDILTFLQEQCKLFSKSNNEKPKHFDKHNKFQNYSSHNKAKTYVLTIDKKCAICNKPHAVYACDVFRNLSPEVRKNKAAELKLCYNCLTPGHGVLHCKSIPCKKCNHKHHTMLHFDKPNSYTEQSTSHTHTNFTDNAKVHIVHSDNNTFKYSLLPTALIYVYDSTGKRHEARAYLDSCSQANLITTDFCNKLKLSKHGRMTLTGIEHNNTQVQKTTLKIQSRTTDFSKTLTCLVWDEIDKSTPSPQLQSQKINIPHGIQLADPHYDKPRAIDILIGVGTFFELLCVGQVKGAMGDPVFQKTVLGWIIGGEITLKTNNSMKSYLIKNNDLCDQLKNFWEIENGIVERKEPLKLDYAESHFRQTTTRDNTGRFIVSIPFKLDKLSHLQSSREMALKRLFSLEKKLVRNTHLKQQYCDFMSEYERLGHMTDVTDKITINSNRVEYYLPHHAVFKESSTTTKLRVVFDGSAKTSAGISINDIQHIGIPVQDDLFSIILRFRQHKIVLSADVAKMYRQIYITREQRPLQRILWRSETHLPIRTFELNTVTYGTASAPFLATRCLLEIANTHNTQNPVVSNIIKHDFYVDDLLTGADTIDDAIQIREQLSQLLSTYGFDLRKWASNEAKVLSSNSKLEQISLQGDKDPKTLGLLWDPGTDILKYTVHKTQTRKFTKRTILSIIAQIYDPLGLVGPAVIPAKVIMQQLWSLSLSWDESLPQDMHTLWEQIYSQIIEINDISIDRFVSIVNCKSIELHGFCDASERAYGACIYICSINKDGKRTSKLLCAKSRVAPLKATTIPRLELQGALLLAQLAHKVSQACNFDKNNWYYWTDSMVALSWIKSPSSRWKTFVANRTAEIHELTNDNWFHVESNDNPADLISRGVSASDLKTSSLWWYGPQWLCKSRQHWPNTPESHEIIPEERSRTFVTLIEEEVNFDLQGKKQPENFTLFQKISTYTKLLRVTAYVLRFVAKCKRHKLPQSTLHIHTSTNLHTTELQDALQWLIKRAQTEMFSSELEFLSKGKNIPNNSKLIQLHPFLDTNGIMRVGGRLEKASIPYETKHPIILHHNHSLTHLIIRHKHLQLLHGGCQLVLATLRERYWILKGKGTIRNVLRKCIPCFRAKPTEVTPFMGNLPSHRVTMARAFSNSGVDYAGPFLIREKSRCRVTLKAYICIFVCMSTKAVHIELASELTTEAFLNCIKRFISRRGLCKNIYSDNAKNFEGASNELQHLKQLLQNEKFESSIANYCSSREISWHFNPARAPHFGGLWEGAVKSAKNHLKRVIGETKLTFEDLYTVLTQVEACLNSRPLSPLSNDPKDLTPLTPGHFLIGDSLTALPQEDIRDVSTNRLKRYQHLQQMVQHFWQRWHSEYLPQLQNRLKWNTTSTQHIKPGLLVLIKDDDTPPLQWPLGRITNIHPGSDGVVRVVSVQGAKSIVTRPVTKICILPCMEP